MKKIGRMMLVLVASAVLFSGLSFLLISTADAGDLANVGLNQTQGNEQKDATGGQKVREVYDRGISWGVLTAYAGILSGTSSAVTMTGASADYVGPYYMKIFNPGVDLVCGSVAAVALSYVTAVGGSTTAKGQIIAAEAATPLTIGPIPAGHFVHMRGTTTTCGIDYQIGHLDD